MNANQPIGYPEIWENIQGFCQTHKTRVITTGNLKAQISSTNVECFIDFDDVNKKIATMARGEKWPLIRIGGTRSGTYEIIQHLSLDEQKLRKLSQPSRASSSYNQEAPIMVPGPKSFNQVGNPLPDGSVLLQDSSGNIWIAKIFQGA